MFPKLAFESLYRKGREVDIAKHAKDKTRR